MASCVCGCHRVDKAPCHRDTMKNTKEQNLSRDAEETTLSQDGKDDGPRLIKETAGSQHVKSQEERGFKGTARKHPGVSSEEGGAR